MFGLLSRLGASLRTMVGVYNLLRVLIGRLLP
jgi:hypothetical protein